MPDTRAHDEVYCADYGLQWVASRPEPEPTRPEPEPPPQPTKPPEPEPPKPEAISQETLGTVERFGYRLGRGIAVVLLVAVVAVPGAVAGG